MYGTLKRGYWNHNAFCEGVLEIWEAQIRGRLYEEPGFPVLEVPDVGTQAHLCTRVGSSSQAVLESGTPSDRRRLR